MRLAHYAVTAAGLASAIAVMNAAAIAAASDTIAVSPSPAHPGERVQISVPKCSVGPTRHWASSEAFPQEVTLYGKADTGDATLWIKRDTTPGTYAITAHCGDGHTISGQVVVADGSADPSEPSKGAGSRTVTPPTRTISAKPTASDSSIGPGVVFWALCAGLVVLAGAIGTFVVVRRRSAGS